VTVDSELRKIWRADLIRMNEALGKLMSESFKQQIAFGELEDATKEAWSRISELLTRLELRLDQLEQPNAFVDLSDSTLPFPKGSSPGADESMKETTAGAILGRVRGDGFKPGSETARASSTSARSE